MNSPAPAEHPGSEQHPPFVLVHGGRHGGWCWRPVAQLLRVAGHDVYTPTLTGLGERAHLLSPQIGLDTHIQDLVAVFEYEDIHDAVLVGHSYGGMVVTGALEQVADRVRSYVLLDGHMPRDGESVFDLNGPERAGAMIALADESGEGWYIPPADATRYGVTDPDDIAWINSRMTAQPLKTYRDPIGATGRAWDHPGLFIECVPSSLEEHLLERARARSVADPRFRHRVLHTAPGSGRIHRPAVAEDRLRNGGRTQKLAKATLRIFLLMVKAGGGEVHRQPQESGWFSSRSVDHFVRPTIRFGNAMVIPRGYNN